METFHHKQQLSQRIDSLKNEGMRIGFVPTMGALHKGHLSLVDIASKTCEVVVVSIFVNPTQFNNPDDLKTYPRTLNKDIVLLKTLDVQELLVYTPAVEDVYGTELIVETFDFNNLDKVMEGAFRKGHFNGVATIVKRLFEIVTPHEAFFGEKDYQQLLIIKTLVKHLGLPIKVTGCPILREVDGLAMSSRNTRLSPSHRAQAPFIFGTLKSAKDKFGTESAKVVTEWVENQFRTNTYLELEYFLITDSETLKPVKRKSKKRSYRAFVAVYAGDIRLIDNIALN